MAELERIGQRDGVTLEAARLEGVPLPLVVYRGALPVQEGEVDEATAEEALARSGWEHQWTLGQGASPEAHYHSTTHEAVAVLRGRTRIRYGFSGELEVGLEAGDVVLHPAGAVHAGVGDEGGVRTAGAYPVGAASWDWVTEPADDVQRERIRSLTPPPHPVVGGALEPERLRREAG